MEFGTVTIGEVSANNIAVSNTVETTLTKLMPGSTISGDLDLEYTGNAAAYFRISVKFYDGETEYSTDVIPQIATMYTDSVTVAAASDKVALSTTVPTSVGNALQGKTVTMKIVVDAIQQANTAGKTNDAHETTSVWKDVTVVEA